MKRSYRRFRSPPKTTLDVCRKMPPLSHHTQGDEFDLAKSDVLAWAFAQPKVKQFLFCQLRDHGLIVFDEATRTWRGADVAKPEWRF